MAEKKVNPYANLSLRRQLYLECRAMAEFGLAKGKTVPADIITTIESFEAEIENTPVTDPKAPKPARHAIDDLVSSHDRLVKIVEPATPQTILLLDMEQEASSLMKFLGPVALVRQLMIVSIVSLALFVGLSISDYVKADAGNIYESDGGISLLINLVFFLASAGLGASFAALYKANTYITNGTFDPTHQASYWIRFFMGLISGLILAVFISDDAMGDNPMIQKGIIRPLLAILGGFSADLVYTILIRLVETTRSLFDGSAQDQIAAKAQEAKIKSAGSAMQTQMKVTGDLVKLQQELGQTTDPAEIQAKLSALINKTLPGNSNEA